MRRHSKRLALATVSFFLSCNAAAATTVTFQGEVTQQTCNVDINGSANSVVLLPTVSINDFGATLAATQTAGLTPFTITVSGCDNSSTSNTAITTNFIGYEVDDTYGVLNNTLSTGDAATGFGIQLLSGSSANSTPVNLNGVTGVEGLELNPGQSTASYDFSAQYFSLGSVGTPGRISAVAEYSISYL